MPALTPASRSTRSASKGASAGRCGEQGNGLLSTAIGLVAFLSLLLFAVQILFNLHATSVVTAVAYDAARRVAGREGGSDTEGVATDDARHQLGRYSDRVEFDWSATDAVVVVLRVRAHNPSMVLPVFAGAFPFDYIDRTVRVRVEQFR